MLPSQVIARAPRLCLNVRNDLVDFLHLLDLDVILARRLATSVLIKGGGVAR